MKKKTGWISLGLLLVLTGTLLLSCRKKEAEEDSGFLNLMPGNTFIYLGFRGWKILRDETKAFDFWQTARRIQFGAHLRQALEQERAVSERVGEKARRFQALREKVSLWDLLGGEAALAAFSLEKGEKPVLAFLCRLPEGEVELYRGYLEELFDLLSEGAGEEMKVESHLGERLTTFPLAGLKIKSRPTWATVGEVFVLTSRPEGTREIVSRLKGKVRRGGLISNPDFRAAFREFDPSGRGVVFIRPDDLIEWGRKIFRYQKLRIDERLKEEGVGEGLRSVWSRQAIYYLRALVKMIRTSGVIAGNFGLSGEGYWEKIRFYLNEEKGSHALLAALRSPPRRWEVLDYVPAGVAGVEVGFLPADKVYRPLRDFVSESPGHGPATAGSWEELQSRFGFNLERDLFPWLGDEYAVCTVSLSRSVADPGSFALLWKVKSESGMEESLDKLIGRLREKFQASLNIIEEEYEGYQVRVMYLPLPVFSVTPTLGKVGEYLVLASRKEAFKQVADTFRKQTESIRQDADFIRMEERLGRQGTDFSFSRLRERTDALITVLRSFSSLLGMTVALANPQTPQEEAEQKAYLKKIALLDDLALVLEDLKAYKFAGRIFRYSEDQIEFQRFLEIERKVKK